MLFFISMMIVLLLIMTMIYSFPTIFINYLSQLVLYPTQIFSYHETRQFRYVVVQSSVSLLSCVIFIGVFVHLNHRLHNLKLIQSVFIEQLKNERDQVNNVMRQVIYCKKLKVQQEAKYEDFCVLFKMPALNFTILDVSRTIQNFTERVVYNDKQWFHPVLRQHFPISKIDILQDFKEVQDLYQLQRECYNAISVSTSYKSTVEKCLLIVKDMITDQQKNRAPFTKYCLVEFRYSVQKQILFQLMKMGYQLHIQQFPVTVFQMPTNLSWDKLGTSKKVRMLGQVYIILVALLTAILCLSVNLTGCYFFLTTIKGEDNLRYLVCVYSFLIQLQAYLLQKLVLKLVHLQYALTVDQERRQIVGKIIVGRVLLQALSVLLPFLAFEFKYSLVNIGMVETAFFLFVVKLFAETINFYPLQEIYRAVMRALITARRGAGFIQLQANYYFQGTQMDAMQSLGSIVQKIMLSALLGPLCPLIYILALFSISLKYCSQKFKLCQIYKEPKKFSNQIVFFCSSFIKLVPLIQSLTVLSLKYPVLNKTDFHFLYITLDILSVLFAAVLAFAPWRTIQRFITFGDQSLSMSLGVQLQSTSFKQDFKKNRAENRATVSKMIKLQQKAQGGINFQENQKIVSLLDKYQNDIEQRQRERQKASKPENQNNSLLKRVEFSFKKNKTFRMNDRTKFAPINLQL